MAEALWQAVSDFETHPKAQFARELEMSLPTELKAVGTALKARFGAPGRTASVPMTRVAHDDRAPLEAAAPSFRAVQAMAAIIERSEKWAQAPLRPAYVIPDLVPAAVLATVVASDQATAQRARIMQLTSPSWMAMIRSQVRTAASRWAMMMTVRPWVIARILVWMMRSLS